MILITGISHTGSSVLLLLFEALGFSIGRKEFPDPWLEILRDPRVTAMIEREETPPWPEVIKHLGGFCYNLNEHVDRWSWNVDHIFVMVRDLGESVRRRVKFKGGRDMSPKAFGYDPASWRALTQEAREAEIQDRLKNQIGALLFNLVPRNYPFTCIEYPRWVQDPNYAYTKLSPALADRVTHEDFVRAFQRIIDPQRVGRY